MPVQRITSTVGLVSPAGSTVATLSASSVTMTQDEGTAPFVTVSVTVAMPTAAQFAMMKPGAGYYLSVLMYPESSPETVPTLLRITDRNRGVEGNVELQAASAEVDILAFTTPTVDRSNWRWQSSVPNILLNVLGRVFGSSGWGQSRYSDGDAFGQDIGTPAYPTYAAAANLITNGSLEYGLDGWSGTNITLTRSTVWANTGSYSVELVPNTTSNVTWAGLNISLSTSTTYTMRAKMRLSGAAQPTNTASAYARTILVSAGVSGTFTILANSAQAPNAVGTYDVSVTYTTPAVMDNGGAVTARLYHGSPQGTSTRIFWDDVMLVEGNGLEPDGVTPTPYFDGATVDGSRGYNYDWQGDAGKSASSRTPVLARDPDSLTWTPGQTAWDFLQPILQAVGVRMWSDGYVVLNGAVVAKVFTATNQFGFAGAAPRVLDGYNLFDLTQVDSWSAEFPDGTPMFADQVILHYVWTDALGAAREAYDVYPATGKKPYFIDKQDTPFPGVGRAQGIYNRISARATMFQGTTWFNRGIYPGKQLSITSARAAGGSALGYVEAVTYDVGRGTTEFRTKQTIAFTSASWFAATGTWASQTGSWAADQ